MGQNIPRKETNWVHSQLDVEQCGRDAFEGDSEPDVAENLGSRPLGQTQRCSGESLMWNMVIPGPFTSGC